MATEQKVVIITGAGRAIGKGLTKNFFSHINTTVVAGIRNTEGEDASALKQLVAANGSSLVLVHLDSTSSADVKNAISILQSRYGISHIDIAIANAGICDHLLPAVEMDLDELARHVDTNTYGVLRLFQATWTLLQNATKPKFVCILFKLGSISSAAGDSAHIGAYGLSKAAANFLVAKINAEHRHLVAFSIDLGLVQTYMGNRGAKFAGLNEAPVTLQQSVEGIAREIEIATKQRCQGVFARTTAKPFCGRPVLFSGYPS